MTRPAQALPLTRRALSPQGIGLHPGRGARHSGRNMRVWLPLAWLALHPLWAEGAAGSLRTTGSRSWAGDIQLGAGVVVARPDKSPAASVPAAEVARLTIGVPESAAGGPPPGTGTGLLGVYFTSTNLAGPAIVRWDDTVHFNWHNDQPMPGFQSDGFSVRWSGYLEAPASDTYTFTLGSDDGGRLRIGDALALDQWRVQDYTETNGTIRLEAGRRYPFVCECFDHVANARVSVFWSCSTFARRVIPKDRFQPASFAPEHKADVAWGPGLLGTYYAGPDLGGNSYSRVDPEINFQWLGVAPAPDLGASRYSVRWSGRILPAATGLYSLHTLTDEGARLWLDGRLAINTWMQPFLIEQTFDITLTAGQPVDVRFETRDLNGQLIAKLLWVPPGGAKTIIPSTCLLPAGAPPRPTVSAGPGTDFPQGVLFVNGALIACPIASASDAAVRFNGLLKNTPVPLTRLARLHLRPTPRDLLAKLPARGAGALIKDGDFAEGDFAGLDDGRVRLGSVLFGERVFEPSAGVSVVALGPAAELAWRWRVKTRDGTQFFVSDLRLEPGVLRLPELGDVSVPLAELEEFEQLELKPSAK